MAGKRTPINEKTLSPQRRADLAAAKSRSAKTAPIKSEGKRPTVRAAVSTPKASKVQEKNIKSSKTSTLFGKVFGGGLAGNAAKELRGRKANVDKAIKRSGG